MYPFLSIACASYAVATRTTRRILTTTLQLLSGLPHPRPEPPSAPSETLESLLPLKLGMSSLSSSSWSRLRILSIKPQSSVDVLYSSSVACPSNSPACPAHVFAVSAYAQNCLPCSSRPNRNSTAAESERTWLILHTQSLSF